MEIFFTLAFLVPLVITIFITVFTFKGKSCDNNHKTLPPGSLGWPIIGETFQFLYEKPEKFVSDRMKKYSCDIFKTHILEEKTVVICGPNGHKFLFSNEQKLFTAFRPHPMQRIFRSYKKSSSPPPPPPVVEAGVKAARQDETQKVLKSPGFLKPEALVRYIGVMDYITQEYMKIHWEKKHEVKVFPLAKIFTLSLAFRFFADEDDQDFISRLVSSFDDITIGMHSVNVNFPCSRFYKANKAAGIIRKELVALIKEKKSAMSSRARSEDILSYFIAFSDPITGNFMPEAEIADKIMGLLVAGYSTVATAVTFFMKYVGERPDVYNKVLAEQMEISACKKPGELLEWDDMQKMKYSWDVVCEVMRLTPPLQGTFREALTDFTYAGYTIPKGWKVYWSVSTTNRNPLYFPNPESFDPSRFDDKSNMPPFAYVPFGGGPRLCPGKEYARLAILTFVHHVVKRFSWKVMLPKENIIGDMMPSPQKGLPIILKSKVFS